LQQWYFLFLCLQQSFIGNFDQLFINNIRVLICTGYAGAYRDFARGINN